MSMVIDNRLVFVHTKKTGGTFIKTLFLKSGIPITNPWRPEDDIHLEHAPITELYRQWPHLRELPSFSFVREPIQWYRSLYAWIVRMGNPNDWKEKVTQAGFERYLNTMINHFPRYATHQILGPAGYGINVKENDIESSRIVTDIGKYETLLQDLYAITTRHGIDLDPALILKTARVKEAGNISDIYVPTSIAKVIMEQEKHIYRLFYNIQDVGD